MKINKILTGFYRWWYVVLYCCVTTPTPIETHIYLNYSNLRCQGIQRIKHTTMFPFFYASAMAGMIQRPKQVIALVLSTEAIVYICWHKQSLTQFDSLILPKCSVPWTKEVYRTVFLVDYFRERLSMKSFTSNTNSVHPLVTNATTYRILLSTNVKWKVKKV